MSTPTTTALQAYLDRTLESFGDRVRFFDQVGFKSIAELVEQHPDVDGVFEAVESLNNADIALYQARNYLMYALGVAGQQSANN